MTKEDKKLLGASLFFAGATMAAFMIAPEATSAFIYTTLKTLNKKSGNKDKYKEAEDVEFEVVGNPKEQNKGATQAIG